MLGFISLLFFLVDKIDSVWKTLDSEPLQLLRQIQEHESAKAALASSLTSPKVGGWGFVPATPTLVPGPDASPFMTWGELDGTPLLLDPSATPSRTGTTTFKLPEITSREKVAQKLTEEASRTYRHKSKIAKLSHTAARLHSPSGPASPFGRERMLSPAAHSLLKAKIGLDCLVIHSCGQATPAPRSRRRVRRTLQHPRR